MYSQQYMPIYNSHREISISYILISVFCIEYQFQIGQKRKKVIHFHPSGDIDVIIMEVAGEWRKKWKYGTTSLLILFHQQLLVYLWFYSNKAAWLVMWPDHHQNHLSHIIRKTVFLKELSIIELRHAFVPSHNSIVFI